MSAWHALLLVVHALLLVFVRHVNQVIYLYQVHARLVYPDAVLAATSVHVLHAEQGTF